MTGSLHIQSAVGACVQLSATGRGERHSATSVFSTDEGQMLSHEDCLEV